MKTFIADIIPKLTRYSQQLDNLTLLTNQHWVVIDETLNLKTVYIFRTNSELLISQNGKVEKAKWEYLGNNSLLIEKKEDSYLFKHGFFDENILALKIDSKEEYVFLVNENKSGSELNSFERILVHLNRKYIEPSIKKKLEVDVGISIGKSQSIGNYGDIAPLSISTVNYKTKQGTLTLTKEYFVNRERIIKATINDEIAPDGRYKLAFLFYVTVKNGLVI